MVSPFRLPSDIEAAIWEPIPFLPLLTGTGRSSQPRQR
jgi:hypothetical protein